MHRPFDRAGVAGGMHAPRRQRRETAALKRACEQVHVRSVRVRDVDLPVGLAAPVRGERNLLPVRRPDGKSVERGRAVTSWVWFEPSAFITQTSRLPDPPRRSRTRSACRSATRRDSRQRLGRRQPPRAAPVVVYHPDVLRPAPVARERDRLAVGRPGRIAVEAGRVCQARLVRAVGGHDEDVHPAQVVPIRLESDLGAVRRPRAVLVDPDGECELLRCAAVRVDRPEIEIALARRLEEDVLAVRRPAAVDPLVRDQHPPGPVRVDRVQRAGPVGVLRRLAEQMRPFPPGPVVAPAVVTPAITAADSTTTASTACLMVCSLVRCSRCDLPTCPCGSGNRHVRGREPAVRI